MNFLTPLFLIGGAALAGPILYHLIRRTTRERRAFSSLLFLQPSPPRISKRHRFEHLLLLLLRCLALLLLALGFSRPFFRETSPDQAAGAQPRRVVLLLDVSASMRRDGLWTAARERAEALLRAAGPADHFALYAFDRAARPLLSFDEWNRTAPGGRVALASARLSATTPGWAGTHLGNALITAAEALAEAEGKASTGAREIILLSDLQSGSRLDALQAYEWPKGVTLAVEPLVTRNVTNAGVQLVAESAEATRAAGSGSVARVRVTNSADARREQFKLGWVGAEPAGAFVGEAIDAYVPPGQSRVFALQYAKGAAASERLVLRGDDETFDNVAYVIPPVPQQRSVLWIGREAPEDAKERLFFLRRALSDTPRVAVKVTARPPGGATLPVDLNAANLIFVGENLPPDTAAAVRAELAAGKTVVFLPRSAAAGATLGALLGRGDIALREVEPPSYAMLGEIDFQHPLFAPFADPRFSDFTKIHFWKYRKLDAAAWPGVRVVAKFDNGDPAILEQAVERGRLVVLTSGWQPEDSQLAVSTKFVPILWSLLELGGSLGGGPTQLVVGEAFPLPAAVSSGTRTIRGPDGATTTLAAGATEFVATTQPGIYEFSDGGRPVRFAVNLDANESRTAPLSRDELEHLGLPVVQPAAETARKSPESAALLQAAEAENRQKLWRWFVTATLAVLLVESALAGWTARRSVSATQEMAS